MQLGLFGGAVEYRDMSDGLDQGGVEFPAHAGDEASALVPVGGVDADLEQLVMGQRQVDFLQHGFRESCCADDDDRLEIVSAGAQEALSFFGEFHD